MNYGNTPLRIAYTIQNVGGIDFQQDIGDTVPVKHTLQGLKKCGHDVHCFRLDGRTVIHLDDIPNYDHGSQLPTGLTGKRSFRLFESGTRRLQRDLGLPYFAFFDVARFYEACLLSLPGFSLCHDHNGLFCTGSALAAKRLGIPYVLTFSADPLLERSLLGKPLRGLHYQVAAQEARFTYQVAKKIICVSEPAKEHLVATWRVEPEKIEVMPNGVDVDLFKPEYDSHRTRAQWGLSDELVIGFVGGFQPWHGLDVLIESFAEVLRDYPSAKLLLVGDGRARSLVDQKIVDCGVGSSVIVTGFIPQTQVPELLSIIDVAVLPYPKLPKELWFSPLKLYEYMAAGKAIVASQEGQIAQVIEHDQTGILVEPGDPVSLSKALIALLNDPSRRSRLGQNAREQAVQRHSWNQYISRLEDIYWSVLNA